MPLTALLIIDDADCAFTVLGVPIVEFQIRQALAAGVTHAVLLIGRMPPALLAATDLLRREGLGIDIARSVSDAIDFVHPDDRVVLIAPRVAVSRADTDAMLRGAQAVALAVSASSATARLDIIDGGRRWTGWATFDGRFLRDVGATIGDWDLAPTILRKLLQAGAETRLAEAPVNLLDQAGERAAVEASLRANADNPARGLGERLITQPAARFGAPLLGDAGLRPQWIGQGGYVFAMVALVFGFAGWIAASSAVMLAASIAWRMASVMTAAVAGAPARSRTALLAQAMFLAVNMIVAGFEAMQSTGQWGCVVLALMLVAALALLRTPLVRERNALTLADCESSLFLIGIGALAGAPAWGLGLAALHAAVSVGARQASLPSSQP